ncbi:5'-methylthioadenosine nucleosidase [bacterium]|nr:5'-methylthioadenosine nucleosidase [bacterium]
MKPDHIALVIAMNSEAAPLIKTLALEKKADLFPAPLPFELYQGEAAGKRISVIVSGLDREHGVNNVGTQSATLMTYLIIAHLHPDLVINAGTAGGIGEKGCQIGDIYLSESPFCYHDRRIPLPRFDQYGIGSYPSIDTTEMAASLGFKTGRISTGDSLDMTDRDLEMIRSNRAIIKEMEAAAVAWVCRMMDIPMFAVKVITDLIDRQTSTEAQFTANLQLAVNNLRRSILQVIDYL